MIMAVILDALLGVLSIKVEFLDNLTKKLFLNRHLLLAWEEALIAVPVLHLERPGVVSNVAY